MWQVLGDLIRLFDVETIIEGCARGADRMAEEFAASHNIPISHFPAEWNKYGDPAGAIRNRQMLREGLPGMVVAFHRQFNQSKGTWDMVDIARKAGIPCDIHPQAHVDYEQLTLL